jgi:hypothetical protein
MMSMHDTLAERYRAHPKIVLPTKIYTVVVTLSREARLALFRHACIAVVVFNILDIFVQKNPFFTRL